MIETGIKEVWVIAKSVLSASLFNST